MTTAIVSKRGRITIPKKMRARLGLKEGMEVIIEETGNGLSIRSSSSFEPAKPQDVIGIFTSAKQLNEDDFEAAIKAVALLHDR